MDREARNPQGGPTVTKPKPPEALLPVGRPSDYDPVYCALVLALGEAGKSKTYMAAKIGVVKNTLDNWAAAHPEFLTALTRGLALSQAWWEDAGQNGLTTTGFQGSVWSRSMAARFPDDWRETSRTEHSGPEGGPIRSEASVDVSKLSADQLRALASIPVPTD